MKALNHIKQKANIKQINDVENTDIKTYTT